MKKFGRLIIFGSGETLDTGRKIQRLVLREFANKQRIAILETPAGFQPNSNLVAKEIAHLFEHSLAEFVENVSIIPARKKGTPESPDNKAILSPLTSADYIFLGPGSPTYTVFQLENSIALKMIIERWRDGATLVLSSAAAIAFGEHCLPVYEIYKAGFDLYWEKGLRVLREVLPPLTIVTHWNNKEGGDKLDTSHCYMGRDRFKKLVTLLPKGTPILGIYEHTAVIFDFTAHSFSIEGVGNISLLKNSTIKLFKRGFVYDIDALF